MPSRWFVPLLGLDPNQVRLEHLHAAFSAWFDDNAVEHAAGEKPYCISPLTLDCGQIGVLIGTLNSHAEGRVAQPSRHTVRLANQTCRVGAPRRVAGGSWTELAGATQSRSWVLKLLTPATFRSGDRSSPLPNVATLIAGLARAWRTWCPDPGMLDVPDASGPSNTRSGRLWVSDLELRSAVLPLRVGGRSGESHTIHLSGVTGSLTLRAVDGATARWAGPLLHLAPFCGVGSMRGKGLGLVDVVARPTE